MTDKLDDLKKRIEKEQEKYAPPPEPAGSDMGIGMRLAIEMASCLGVGGVLGYFLDRLLDTSPIFLMVCLALGAAAGFKTILRTAKAMEDKDKVK